jgi:LysR family nod box-dependent transcriptional activator
MSLQHFNLNLLASLDALLRERSVTSAAARMGVSQPTMSGMLNRLRAQLGDPLLVRVGQSYELTARAAHLADTLHQTLLNIESLVRPLEPVDLSALARRFTIMASEVSLFLLLPQIFRPAAILAPKVTFHIVPIDDPMGSVYAGKIDLCITGNTVDDVEGTAAGVVRTRTLWDGTCVGLVDGNHPLSGEITMQQFLSYPHAATQFPGVSRTVEDLGISGLSRVHPPRVRVASFLALGPIVAGTDMIGVFPNVMVDLLNPAWGLRTVALPRDFAKLSLRALWHSRDDQDEAHQWLRSLVTDACAGLSPRTQRGA